MRLQNIALLFLFILLSSGCSTQAPSPEGIPHTLAANPDIPEDSLRRTLTSKQWKKLRTRSYTGFVILRGALNTEGGFTTEHVIEAYPDATRNQKAQDLSRRIRIKPVIVGSNILPTADIYVLFYEERLPRTAYVFGRQLDTVGPTSDSDYSPQVYTQFY